MKANIIQDAWFVRGQVCDATVTAQLDGVTISIPGHSEVQVFICTNELRQLLRLVDGSFSGLNLGRYKRDVLLQGGGVTTKLVTAEKLADEGFVEIHETARGRDVIRFDLDPSRAAYAARYSLTDEGEKIRHMLANGGVG